jgi:hypothetical protein
MSLKCNGISVPDDEGGFGSVIGFSLSTSGTATRT